VAEKKVLEKYKISEYEFGNLINSCLEEGYIKGIDVMTNANGNYRFTLTNNLYITIKDYQFMNEYKYWYLPLLSNIILIIITATITVLVTNIFTTSKKNNCYNCYELDEMRVNNE